MDVAENERPTVLVVDDTPTNLKLLSSLLKEQYRVKVAASGIKALELAASAPPDLVLLDIMMPEMDGYEVCRRLKSDERTRHVPVIFLTAKSEPEDEELGFSAGAVDFIHKPISPPIVAARVKIHLEIKALHDFLHARNQSIKKTFASEVARLLDVIREQNESRQRELEAQVQARTAELAEKNEQLRAASHRVQEELNLARAMQLAILPQHFPDDANWSVAATMNPARELSGDFYDCFSLADGRYGVLVADVSGKGVGAAFFMAVSRTVLLDLATAGGSPAEVFARANDLLCERNPMDLFVTALYAIFDPRDGRLVYSSAGHPSPLLRHATGSVESLDCPTDVALGVMAGMSYSDSHAQVERGDTLLLYTDGVTEAFSKQWEIYGEQRLRDWFARTSTESARELLTDLVRDVAVFVGEAEASDDLTCLVLCRKA
jgi:serine phosphatase RsbU (regulator of sigma subunit)